MIMGYFLFASNVPKRYVESLHQMGIIVSSETIWQVLNTNAVAILKNLQNCVQSKRFFISYDNMNFYKNVRDQRLHNCVRLLFYTAEYVCFMKASDLSPLSHLTSDDINYPAINNFLSDNVLLSSSNT